MLVPSLQLIQETEVKGVNALSDDPWDDPDIIISYILGTPSTTTVYENVSILFTTGISEIHGTVIMRNVTILLEDDARIRNCGSLLITDLDNDPFTMEDNSRLIGNSTSAIPEFRFGSDVTVKNYSIRNSNITNILFNGNGQDSSFHFKNCSINYSMIRDWNHHIENCEILYSSISFFDSIIERSYLANSSLFTINSKIRDLNLINSTIRTRGSSLIENINSKGYDRSITYGIVTIDVTTCEIRNITLTGYDTAIFSSSETLIAKNLTIDDCYIGIISDSTGSVYVTDSRIKNTINTIENRGLVSLQYCEIEGGGIDIIPI
jgi:hypothetical protein